MVNIGWDKIKLLRCCERLFSFEYCLMTYLSRDTFEADIINDTLLTTFTFWKMHDKRRHILKLVSSGCVQEKPEDKL